MKTFNLLKCSLLPIFIIWICLNNLAYASHIQKAKISGDHSLNSHSSSKKGSSFRDTHKTLRRRESRTSISKSKTTPKKEEKRDQNDHTQKQELNVTSPKPEVNKNIHPAIPASTVTHPNEKPVLTESTHKPEINKIEPHKPLENNHPVLLQNNPIAERINSNAENQNMKSNTDSIKSSSTTDLNNKNNNNEKSSVSGYFTRTSKHNQSNAGKAFASFIAGFILLYLSIYFICSNEKNNVLQTQFIDWMQYQVDYIAGYKEKELKNNSPYIMEGRLSFYEKPNIPVLDLDFQTKNIFYIEFCLENFKSEYNYNNQYNNFEAESVWESREIPLDKKTHFGGKLIFGEDIIIDYDRPDILDKCSLNEFKSGSELNGYEENLKEFLNVEYNVQKPYISYHKDPITSSYHYYLTNNEMNSNIDQNFLVDGDVRININYYCIEEKTDGVVAGQVSEKISGFCYLEPCVTPISESAPGWFFCCFNYSTQKKKLLDVAPFKNKESYIESFTDVNIGCTNCLRFFLFFCHFISYYLILYPFILIFGMIPFIGIITSFILILFAFIFSILSYLAIFIVAWIFARPIFASLLIALWISIVVIGKIVKEKIASPEPKNNLSFNELHNHGNTRKMLSHH